MLTCPICKTRFSNKFTDEKKYGRGIYISTFCHNLRDSEKVELPCNHSVLVGSILPKPKKSKDTIYSSWTSTTGTSDYGRIVIFPTRE